LTRVAYMGSSSFAVPALRALLADGGIGVCAVVTQPDRVRGRGGKVAPTPVKAAAAERGVPVLQPERIRGNEDFLAALRETAPDLIVVASYGKLLPIEVLGLPPCGCVNIHASLLPKYRGAAPIRWAIADGETETGVTLIYMGEGLDDGDMIARSSISVDGRNAGELTEKLALAGAGLLMENMPDILSGTAPRIPQEESQATYARRIEKEDEHINPALDADAVLRRIRAMSPEPGAYMLQGDLRVRVLGAHIADEATRAGLPKDETEPGAILKVTQDGIFVQTGDGVLVIDIIGMPGKRPMRTADYLRGNRFGQARLE